MSKNDKRDKRRFAGKKCNSASIHRFVMTIDEKFLE